MAPTVSLSTRAKQLAGLNRAAFPDWFFLEMDVETNHSKFLAGVLEQEGEVELLQMSANLTESHLQNPFGGREPYNKDSYQISRLGASNFYRNYWRPAPTVCLACAAREFGNI